MFKQGTNLISWVVSGALLVGALGLVVFATPLFGIRMLIVRSGSMEPAISVGDVVIVRPGEYQTGDAIAYNVPGREAMVVTHRIQEVRDGAKGFEYVTKGDANAAADTWVVTARDIVGKELFVVPWVGTLLAFAKSRVGFVSLVIAPALIVILSEVSVILRELRHRVRTPSVSPLPPLRMASRGEAEQLRVLNPAVAFISSPPPPIRVFVDGIIRRGANVALLLLMFSLMTPATFALYTDTGTSANNTFTAADNFGVGPGDVVINEIMWMGSSVSTADEWIELRNMTSGVVDLTGWKITKAGTNSSPDITLSGTIPANGYWLLGNNNAATSAILDSIAVDQVTTAVELTNGGEQLTLKDPGGTTIDASPVTSGGWPHGDNGSNKQSMSRNDPPGDGTVASNWHTCTNAACNDTTYWDVEGNNYGTTKATNL